jgi:hypothetical protein
MKFDEKSNFFLNPPFFYFHGNCGKVCPTDCDFFGLSLATVAMETKKGGFKLILDSFHQIS